MHPQREQLQRLVDLHGSVSEAARASGLKRWRFAAAGVKSPYTTPTAEAHHRYRNFDWEEIVKARAGADGVAVLSVRQIAKEQRAAREIVRERLLEAVYNEVLLVVGSDSRGCFSVTLRASPS